MKQKSEKRLAMNNPLILHRFPAKPCSSSTKLTHIFLCCWLSVQFVYISQVSFYDFEGALWSQTDLTLCSLLLKGHNCLFLSHLPLRGYTCIKPSEAKHGDHTLTLPGFPWRSGIIWTSVIIVVGNDHKLWTFSHFYFIVFIFPFLKLIK